LLIYLFFMQLNQHFKAKRPPPGRIGL